MYLLRIFFPLGPYVSSGLVLEHNTNTAEAMYVAFFSDVSAYLFNHCFITMFRKYLG